MAFKDWSDDAQQVAIIGPLMFLFACVLIVAFCYSCTVVNKAEVDRAAIASTNTPPCACTRR